MSPNKENYLKTIFELKQDQRKVTNKNIADILEVSAPSVTEMLSSLAKEQLIKHNPYGEITLTSEGKATAEKMVRLHRIWEVFLNTKLNYSIAEIHQAADVLEHATDDKLMERLNYFLEVPARCPHGGIIPGNAKETSIPDLVLADVTNGTEVTIKRVIDHHDFLVYFQSLNLDLDTHVKVIQHQPFEGPLTIEDQHGRQLDVSFKAAHYIFVDYPHTKDPQ